MSRVFFSSILTFMATTFSGCSQYATENDQYLYRIDPITLSAGNAKDVNAAAQIIDPWPRYVGNRRIPANGERMVGAVQRYQGRQGARGQPVSGAVSGSSDIVPGNAMAPATGAAVPTMR